MNKVVRIYVGFVAIVFLLMAFAGRSFATETAPAVAPAAVPEAPAPVAVQAAPVVVNDKGEKEITLTIKDHKFDYELVEVKAGDKFVLVVKNADASAEEFESHSLKREKVIPGGGTARFPLGPLKAGTHIFFGEFHEATAKGKLVVTE